MTTFSAQQLGSPKTSRLKGPETSVGSDGDWSPGLLRSHAYEKLLTDIILGDLAAFNK